MRKRRKADVVEKVCPGCGKTFTTVRARACSKSCREKTKDYGEYVRVKKKDNKLTHTNQKAKDQGLTYGQYQAQAYIQNTKIEFPEWTKKKREYNQRRKEFLELCEKNE